MTDNNAGLVDGERGRRIRARDRRLMRPFMGVHRRIIQASSGRILAHLGGHPLLVLTTTGRRSGQPRSTPVIGIPEGEGWFIVASNGGAATQPLWLRNLATYAEVSIQRGGRTNSYLAQILPPDERDRCWPALVRAYPTYTKMQAKTDRALPVVRLQPAIGPEGDRDDMDA
jgi:deazaflavin-dependent oxidoreductase (nitroreductase family)